MNDKILYHGSDRIVSSPIFMGGKEDNDYGNGFYTTEDYIKAEQWAITNGGDNSFINKYLLDMSNLNVLILDDYGPLAWIAEIVYHRGTRKEEAKILGNIIAEKYKINTDNADIIIGYRADDSYMDIADAFLENKISLDETIKMFKKGKLGEQVFIKSKEAFDLLIFKGYEQITITHDGEINSDEIKARMEVSRFLKNRDTAILLNGYQPSGLTARDVANQNYIYNQETQYYELKEQKKDIIENEEDEHDDGR